MRVHPEKTVDEEFKWLGDLGYTGTINDRQFKYLRSLEYTGALPDMFGKLNSGYGFFFTSNGDQFVTSNGFNFKVTI